MDYSEEELHIVCPWHGYEYSIRTGRNAGNPRLRLKPDHGSARQRCLCPALSPTGIQQSLRLDRGVLRKASRWTAQQAIQGEEASLISDEAVRRIMTAAIKLYVAKSDGEERTFRPLTGKGDEDITATEVLSAVAELLRAMRLGPMEFGLWYRRRPDE